MAVLKAMPPHIVAEIEDGEIEAKERREEEEEAEAAKREREAKERAMP